MNVLQAEYSWLCLFEISINENIIHDCFFVTSLRRSSNHNYSQDWLNYYELTRLLCLALPCLVYGRENSLMNFLKGECSWLCLFEISINPWLLFYYFTSAIFKPRLHTILTELLQTSSPALPCFVYGRVNSLINVLQGKCSWLCLLEISINVNVINDWLLFFINF